MRSEVLGVYLDVLKAVWFGAMAFGATGLIAVAVEKHVPLRTELETSYGSDEEKRNDVEDSSKSSNVNQEPAT